MVGCGSGVAAVVDVEGEVENLVSHQLKIPLPPRCPAGCNQPDSVALTAGTGSELPLIRPP